MTKTKICGITNLGDALDCCEAGADFLGFVFFNKSRRFISVDKAREIIEKLPTTVFKVGIFVNEDPLVVQDIAKKCCLDFLQFHGDETSAYLERFQQSKVIKAVRVQTSASLENLKLFHPAMFLFDAFKEDSFGGTGEVFDWTRLGSLDTLKTPFFVSGGLTPGNVSSLVGKIHPFAVDVSSGVERAPGKKDKRLVKSFMEAVRKTSKYL